MSLQVVKPVDSIQQFFNKTSQPQFDKDAIDRWRRKAPDFYRQFPGVKYVGTYILERTPTVEYIPEEQIRQLKIILENVPSLEKAFLNGIDYTIQPPSVEKVGRGYKGRSGWTRDVAFGRLGWLHYFYDVLEFSSPLARRRYMAATNRTFLPKVGNTYGDIFRTIRTMIDEKEIEGEDMIRAEVNFLYVEGDDNDREDMVDELKKTAGIPIGHIRTYHSKNGLHSTQLWAAEHNAPYGGDQNKKLKNRIGYVMHSASAMGTWLNMIVKAYDKSIELKKRVYCEARAYIKNPKPADFSSQREEFDTIYGITRKKLEKVIRHCVTIENGEIKVDLGVLWKGFLPQDETPDPTNGGKAVELSEVDKDGNPMQKPVRKLAKVA
jgi:hypothetical protein